MIKLTEKLLKSIRAAKPADKSEDQWLIEEMDRLEGIVEGISQALRAMERAKKEYDKVCIVENGKIDHLQKSCDHYDTTYHPDASGNNDSCTVCNICGQVT